MSIVATLPPEPDGGPNRSSAAPAGMITELSRSGIRVVAEITPTTV